MSNNVLAGPGVGPGRFEFEKVGSRDGGGDVDEEWNVIGRKARSRGKGSVRESICPCKVKKTRSSHSRVGEARLLDQVNLRSSKGNSISARLSKVWLNALASAGWKAVLFFRRGNR